MVSWQAKVLPAPLLRHEFDLDGDVRQATLRLSGLGYYELHLNGAKVGDRVLDPIVTVYDKRVRYATYDVTDCLRAGRNAVGVILGNGWYNCATADVWHFDKATWRDYPKLLLQLDVDLANGRRLTVASGPDWQWSEGPIRFDQLRNGETYDARAEVPGWDTAGFAAAGWQAVAVVPPPGGVLEEQTAPPCKVMATLPADDCWTVANGDTVFDIGQNIAGWARLEVEGPAGTEITLRYAEMLTDTGEVNQRNIKSFVKSGDCQTDRYILKGSGVETWEPRFTYHGFRYVQVSGLPGPATLAGRVVHSAFATAGTFTCSDEMVNRVQDATLWSYRGNFVGIPTDCPHREKNGWTGDTQIAAETGLMNFANAEGYRQWLATMADTQRPSGQFPGIAPTSGWGYNWGNGPAWDGAFILIPWYLYLYTGDTRAVADHYEGMTRYIDLCANLAQEHILNYGLGDWCPPDQQRVPPAVYTSTAYWYVQTRLVARFAGLLGRDRDAATYTALAARIRDAFNREYYRGDGVYLNGFQTTQACALYQDLVPEAEIPATVARLVDAVHATHDRPDVGILGAKYVPRALADHGHTDLAWRWLTQWDYPGWVYWLRRGATTLWESWGGGASLNHIMFGDISAWFYHYVAGIRPDPAAPGFARASLAPYPVTGLTWARAEYLAPAGPIRVAWERTGDTWRCEVATPVPGVLHLPDGSRRDLVPGDTAAECALPDA